VGASDADVIAADLAGGVLTAVRTPLAEGLLKSVADFRCRRLLGRSLRNGEWETVRRRLASRVDVRLETVRGSVVWWAAAAKVDGLHGGNGQG
jgi:hypothetical protein